tara:strand:+ start:39 stop:1097 length:1059 start_codon:yes stop_codon:yes gene_type:complete
MNKKSNLTPPEVSVLALKNDHTIYETLRDAVAEIELDVNIIGLDDPTDGMHIKWYHDRSLYDTKPFFFYIEEYDTFKGRHNSHHWQFDDPHDNNFTNPRNEFLSPPILNHPNFKGFISHIQDTCNRLYDEFKTPVYHLPLCSSNILSDSFNRVKDHIESLDDRPVHLIAWSSWNDIHDNNFINRGGDVVDRLVCDLFDLGCDIRFSMRTLRNMQCKMGFDERVDIYHDYLTEEEKDALFSEGDIFLLPSDQVHSASITYAMSFGMPCVVSDGWGISEFCNSLNSIPLSDLMERYRGNAFVKANLNDAVVNICNDKELLKLKRRNTLSHYMANHSRSSYIHSIGKILHTGTSW